MNDTLTSPELTEIIGKLTDRQKKLAEIFTEAGPDMDMAKVKSIDGDSAAKVAAIKSLNDEMTALGTERDRLETLLKGASFARQFNVDEALDQPSTGRKGSIGEQFKAAGLHLPEKKNQAAEFAVDLKTLMTTSAGFAPESVRSGLIVPNAQRPVQVSDIIPQVPTGQAAYKYMEETTHTNSSAETSEGGTYGESAFAFTERTSTVQKITVWLPVTDEQLEDEASVGPWIDMMLPRQILQRLDGQILVGNGTTPNLRGVNNVAGIQTQAKGADPTPDAVYKALVLVRVTGRAFPSHAIFHPLDWQDVRLLRTVDGIYIWGNPSEAGPERIWGVNVVQSDAQTQNTAVVGDFTNFSLLAVRRGIEMKVSDSHSTFFVEGKQAIRADMRAALMFTRPAAFCTVTGI